MGLDAVVHRQTEPGLEPMVDVVDVHKSFGRTEVLKGINLSVAPGEVVCIVGPSGSGKSTLLRLVNFLETLDRGLIFVDGEIVGYQYEGGRLHDRKEADVARMRCQCCMVFQQFNLFGHMTALENVLVGPLPRAGPAARRGRARGPSTTRTGWARTAPTCLPGQPFWRGTATRQYRPGTDYAPEGHVV